MEGHTAGSSTRVANTANDVLDIPAFLERVGGDTSFFAEIATLFKAECPKLLANLDNAVNTKNFTEIELQAHSIKGMSANINAERMRAKAYELEVMGKQQRAVNDNNKTLEEMTKELHDEFKQVCHAIDANLS